ncbi:hypothetical protein F503_05377 [Ophiostoma piceae UAMH 11346]|uniref:Uncharacterized protein n=1 Tax=Ophiostoma piceae (strain UAMH 11346) TaxID=1262450 RepID=S3CBM3_OPHP1|nr:hypothetical protein F503_05377 [Ophiostoma piceae UAMH 11346]
MTDCHHITRPPSPTAHLAAPLMSVSSSSTSLASSQVWSAQPSRRGSNASSIAPIAVVLDTKKTTTETSASVTPPTEPVTISAPVSTAASRRTRLVHTGDPLSRTYPKPEGDLDLAEALAREPLRWSLGHWRKNAHNARFPESATLSSEASKKRFQDAKNDLLRSHASLQGPSKKL